MPTYNLPHIDISARRLRRDYQDRPRNLSELGVPRTREEHGARIRAQLQDVGYFRPNRRKGAVVRYGFHAVIPHFFESVLARF